MSKYQVGDSVKLTEAAYNHNIADGVTNQFRVLWVRENNEDQSATLYGLDNPETQIKVFESELE